MFPACLDNTEAFCNQQQHLLCANVDGLEGHNVDAQQLEGINDLVELQRNVPQAGQTSISKGILVNQ